jgi:hypothetical protein
MIGFKIKDSNEFVLIPNISCNILESYIKTFKQHKDFIDINNRNYVIQFDDISAILKENCIEELPESIMFFSEISKENLLEFGRCLIIYNELNERVGELMTDFKLNYIQEMRFSKMVKKLEPLLEVSPIKYLQKLSAYLDVFLMDFYEIKEITDTRFTVELILEKVTCSNLLLGNNVESKIYLLLPY